MQSQSLKPVVLGVLAYASLSAQTPQELYLALREMDVDVLGQLRGDDFRSYREANNGMSGPVTLVFWVFADGESPKQATSPLAKLFLEFFGLVYIEARGTRRHQCGFPAVSR